MTATRPPVARTAREVVELYNLVMWNQRDFGLADELLADEVRRHEVGEVHVLTREQARERIQQLCASVEDVRFELPLIVAGEDGEHVAIVYQAEMVHRDAAPDAIASIEVFRVIEGRITDVWNNTHQSGYWR